MYLILGILVILCIVFLILNRCYESMNIAIWMIAFVSCTILFSVLCVWGITLCEARRDYGFMEEYLRDHDSGSAVSSAHFLELYTKYKRENQYWIGHQFNGRPPKVLKDLFDKDYRLSVVFE